MSVGSYDTERDKTIRKSHSQEELSIGYNQFGEDIQNKRVKSNFKVRARVHSLMYQSVVEVVEPTESLIDLGCGDGGLTSLLKEKSDETLGLDISVSNIELARTRYSKIGHLKFEIQDVCATNFPNESFDSI